MKKNEDIVVKQWLNIAKDDWQSANDLFASGIFRNTCIFSQQAVEKYLKALLAATNIRFGKTHNLEELNGILVKNGIQIGVESNTLKKLSAFYIEARYPDAYFEIYTKKEAQEALDEAELAINKIRIQPAIIDHFTP